MGVGGERRSEPPTHHQDPQHDSDTQTGGNHRSSVKPSQTRMRTWPLRVLRLGSEKYACCGLCKGAFQPHPTSHCARPPLGETRQTRFSSLAATRPASGLRSTKYACPFCVSLHNWTDSGRARLADWRLADRRLADPSGRPPLLSLSCSVQPHPGSEKYACLLQQHSTPPTFQPLLRPPHFAHPEKRHHLRPKIRACVDCPHH